MGERRELGVLVSATSAGPGAGRPGDRRLSVELVKDGDERTIRRRIGAFFADRERGDLLLAALLVRRREDARGWLYLAARDTNLVKLCATAVSASFDRPGGEDGRQRDRFDSGLSKIS